MTEEMEEFDIENHEREVKKRLRQRRVRGKQVHLKHIHTFCRFLVSSLLIVGTYYLLKLPGWYINPEAFAHSDSEVIKLFNNEIVPDEKIYTLLSGFQAEGTPIFVQKTDELKKLLLELPPVEDVYIRRYAFPARLQIIVKERVPAIAIAPSETAPVVAAFAKDGTMIGHEFMPLPPGLKTIKVLSYGNRGDDYTKWDINRINAIVKIAKYVSTYSKEPVEYIDMRNPQDIYVKIKTVNIRLGKLDGGVYDRIKRIPSILPQVKLTDAKIKYLDLSWEKVNYLKLE